MINKKIQLTAPYLFDETLSEVQLKEDQVIVKPLYLSICAADLRYYMGEREHKVLKSKLPMSLIHEAVGEVVFDSKGIKNVGEHVVMIPNIPSENKKYKENYCRDSKFRSSSADGFMQDIVAIDRDRLISLDNIDLIAASMLELMSVIYNSLDDVSGSSISDGDTFGVWGNGNLGYLANIILKDKYPNSKVFVFGKNEEKNRFFKQADKTFEVSENIPSNLVDHAFECVGGNGSESAINQIIDVIRPQGTIALLGVSENFPKINTRMILEKGLRLQGSSRSGYNEFSNAVNFLRKSKKNQEAVKRLVTEIVPVNSILDAKKAFDMSISNNFKTIMEWNV